MRFVTSPVGQIVHANYSATTTPALKSLTALCVTLLIRNTDATISISVSFDGGTTYFSIPAEQTLALEVAPNLRSYYVQSASGTVAVQTLMGVEI